MANPVQTWREYEPTKGAMIWSCVGSIFGTVLVGFFVLGWQTAGAASAKAENAALNAREDVVASICVQRFVNAPDAADKLVDLKETEVWKRDSMIEDGGWAEIAALDEAVPEAAELCADRLADMEGLPARMIDMSREAAKG